MNSKIYAYDQNKHGQWLCVTEVIKQKQPLLSFFEEYSSTLIIPHKEHKSYVCYIHNTTKHFIIKYTKVFIRDWWMTEIYTKVFDMNVIHASNTLVHNQLSNNQINHNKIVTQ